MMMLCIIISHHQSSSSWCTDHDAVHHLWIIWLTDPASITECHHHHHQQVQVSGRRALIGNCSQLWSDPLGTYMAKELPADLARSTLYTTYVRPTLEYASSVWHGGLLKQQSLALERVQARVAPWTTSKNVLFEQLQWPFLNWRWSNAATCQLHQLLQNPTDPLRIAFSPFLLVSLSTTSVSLDNLSFQLTRTSRYLNSFFYH